VAHLMHFKHKTHLAAKTRNEWRQWRGEHYIFYLSSGESKLGKLLILGVALYPELILRLKVEFGMEEPSVRAKFHVD